MLAPLRSLSAEHITASRMEVSRRLANQRYAFDPADYSALRVWSA